MHCVLIETIHEDSVEWGVSFTDANPEPQDYVRCHSKQDAHRLYEWLQKE